MEHVVDGGGDGCAQAPFKPKAEQVLRICIKVELQHRRFKSPTSHPTSSSRSSQRNTRSKYFQNENTLSCKHSISVFQAMLMFRSSPSRPWSLSRQPQQMATSTPSRPPTASKRPARWRSPETGGDPSSQHLRHYLGALHELSGRCRGFLPRGYAPESDGVSGRDLRRHCGRWGYNTFEQGSRTLYGDWCGGWFKFGFNGWKECNVYMCQHEWIGARRGPFVK